MGKGNRAITSRQNQYILYVNGLKEKKNRDRDGVYRAEGKKLLRDAVKSGAVIREIIITERAQGDAEIRGVIEKAEGTPVIQVTEGVYAKISGGIETEGVMSIVEKPAGLEIGDKLLGGELPPVVILDGVQDAGNVGTIVRTADALLDEPVIILSEGCADIYGDKAVRSSMGGIFRVTAINSVDIAVEIGRLKGAGYKIIAGCLESDSEEMREEDFGEACAIILGSEGKGIRGEISELADRKVIIPINERSDSLNVSAAGAVMMWEIRRKRRGSSK